MLTKSDKKYLEETIDQKLDQKLDDKLKPIKQKLNIIQKTLTTSIKLSESQLKYHHTRLTNLEEKVGIAKPDYVSFN